MRTKGQRAQKDRYRKQRSLETRSSNKFLLGAHQDLQRRQYDPAYRLELNRKNWEWIADALQLGQLETDHQDITIRCMHQVAIDYGTTGIRRGASSPRSFVR